MGHWQNPCVHGASSHVVVSSRASKSNIGATRFVCSTTLFHMAKCFLAYAILIKSCWISGSAIRLLSLDAMMVSWILPMFLRRSALMDCWTMWLLHVFLDSLDWHGCKRLSFVMSFGGATLGNALIYLYPALMFRGAVKKMGDKATPRLKIGVKFAMANAGLGITMGLIGAKMALKSIC